MMLLQNIAECFDIPNPISEIAPFGAHLLTYMQTVRFWADYQNGNTHYKTK